MNGEERGVMTGDDTGTRRRNKGQTTADLVAASFKELADQSLDGLSIRGITGNAGVTPAAFYRHFADIDELSVVLVDRSIDALTSTVRTALRDLSPDNGPSVIAALGSSLKATVNRDREMMAFVARERFSGRPVARAAIQNRMRSLTLYIASEVRSKTRMQDWDWDDAIVAADLLLNLGIWYIEQCLTVAPNSSRSADLDTQFFKMMFLVIYGADAYGSLITSGGTLPSSEFDDGAALIRSESELQDPSLRP